VDQKQFDEIGRYPFYIPLAPDETTRQKWVPVESYRCDKAFTRDFQDNTDYLEHFKELARRQTGEELINWLRKHPGELVALRYAEGTFYEKHLQANVFKIKLGIYAPESMLGQVPTPDIKVGGTE
jgi:hypothetical protein